MKELIFYAVVALVAAVIRYLLFSVMSSPCEGLCDILASGFIFVVILGVFRKLPVTKQIFR